MAEKTQTVVLIEIVEGVRLPQTLNPIPTKPSQQIRIYGEGVSDACMPVKLHHESQGLLAGSG